MTSLSATEPSSNEGPSPRATTTQVNLWEAEVMSALRGVRHHIDWGTGCASEEIDGAFALKNRADAHERLSRAEEFIDEVLDALRDLVHERERAGGPEADADSGFATAVAEMSRIRDLNDEAGRVNAAIGRSVAIVGAWVQARPRTR